MLTITITRRHHLDPFARRALVAALPLLLFGCGGDDSKPILVTEVPSSEADLTVTGGIPPGTAAAVSLTSVGDVVTTRVPTFEEAEATFRAGDFVDAKAKFKAYVIGEPEKQLGFYMLGLAAWKSGDLATAERAFDEAIALDSTHVKSYLNSARVYLDAGRDHEAIERVLTALDLDSASTEGFRLLARAQYRLGDLGAALDTYRHALVVNEKDAWTMNNLGMLYLDEGDPESALPPLARTVELRPTSPVFQNNLGTALERAGLLGAAKRSYQAALRADSGYAKARTSLARVTELLERDPSRDIVANLSELAQLFRMHIQMWRDTEVRPVVSDEPPVVPAAPDTVVNVVPVARDTASCPGC